VSNYPLCNAAGMSSAASLSADFARDGIFRNVQELLNRRHFESGLRKTELRFQGVEAMENVLIGGVGVFGALRRGSGKGDGIGMRMRTVPRLHSEAGMVAEHQIVTVIAATQRFLAVTREAQLRLQPRAPRDGEPRSCVAFGKNQPRGHTTGPGPRGPGPKGSFRVIIIQEE